MRSKIKCRFLLTLAGFEKPSHAQEGKGELEKVKGREGERHLLIDLPA